MRLLLADDRSKIRFALRTLLKLQTGLTIVGEAATADELLTLVEQTSPDVVLLDWGLRGLQADELLSALRSICPNTRVIALSSRLEVCASALAAGADAFVSKIDSPERLLEAIADCRKLERGNEEADP